jgi:hypothetical protein
MPQILFFGALVALAAVLFALAGRVRAPVVGALLLAGGGAVFAVRLLHAGPYPVPQGADLAVACANLLLGLLLVARGRTGRAGSPVGLPSRVLLGLSPFALFFALAHTLHEVGEVVVLRTAGERQALRETRLWVVDYRGSPWVVTGPSTPHVEELAANPRAGLVRGGVARCFVAERHADRKTIEAVLRERHAKYLAQRLAVALGVWPRSPEDLERVAVAIRFEPCPAESP